MPNDAPSRDPYNSPDAYAELEGDLLAYPDIAARVGTPAPSFRLTGLDENVIVLDELCARGEVVLIFGSYSAPPVVRFMPEIEKLHRKLATSGVSFVFVYVRGIHPHAPRPPAMRDMAPHASMEAKIGAAHDLRDSLGLTMSVGVDDLQGSLHRAYGALPFSQAVVHRDGTLVHRAAWVEPTQLESVLSNLAMRAERSEVASPKLTYCETIWFSETSEKNTGTSR